MANPTVREFEQRVRQLTRAYLLIPWMVGDLVNEFLDVRGEEGWQYIDAKRLGVGNDVLMDWIRTADKFDNPDDRLDEKLSIWYYKEVRNLPYEEAIQCIKLAIKKGWSVQDLRLEVRKRRMTSSEAPPISSSLSDSTQKVTESPSQKLARLALGKQFVDSD